MHRKQPILTVMDISVPEAPLKKDIQEHRPQHCCTVSSIIFLSEKRNLQTLPTGSPSNYSSTGSVFAWTLVPYLHTSAHWMCKRVFLVGTCAGKVRVVFV